MEKFSVVLVSSADHARKRLRNMLKRYGYQMIGEGLSLAEGLRLTQRFHPDVVVIEDITTDWFELCRSISQGRLAPILLILYQPDEEIAYLAARCGVTCILVRPFSYQNLISAVEFTANTARCRLLSVSEQ